MLSTLPSLYLRPLSRSLHHPSSPVTSQCRRASILQRNLEKLPTTVIPASCDTETIPYDTENHTRTASTHCRAHSGRQTRCRTRYAASRMSPKATPPSRSKCAMVRPTTWLKAAGAEYTQANMSPQRRATTLGVPPARTWQTLPKSHTIGPSLFVTPSVQLGSIAAPRCTSANQHQARPISTKSWTC